MYRNLCFLLVLLSCVIKGQDFPKEDFGNPLGFTNYLAGNFAELRGFHFHSGIDIKTKQREGYPVYAVADGYVSRINISPRGYGNAIYVTHDNGYTSLYGHLQQLKGGAEDYARQKQYELKKFKINVFPSKNSIRVKRGDVIGISGNSGSSGGPHLHFEIRDTKTEEIINPFLFGYNVADTSAPFINGLYVYAINGEVAGKSRYDMTGGTHFNSPIYASGDVFFGIKTYDKHNGTDNWNGIYSIEAKVNNETTFFYKTDRFAFYETRYINCLTDYKQYMTNKGWIYKLYKAPGDKLQMIQKAVNDGIVSTQPGEKYHVEIVVKDFAGNAKTASFNIVGKEGSLRNTEPSGMVLYWNKENHFENEDIEIWMPKGSLYEDVEFEFKKENGKYYILNDKIPLHKFYTLAIKPQDIPPHKLNKAVIAVKYNYGGKWKTDYFPTEYKNGNLTADVRDFGIFVVEIDDKNPTINPINVKENATFTSGSGVMKFSIKDDQSGVESHDAFIDDKWVLTSYDLKNNRLTLDLNKENIAPGNHKLELKVTDGKNNVATYTVNFKKSS